MSVQFELYKKCIKGQCTPEEASLVESWLKEDAKAFEAEMLAEITQMDKDKGIPSHLKQEMLDYFRQKGLPVGPESMELPAMAPVYRKLKWIKWTAAAAVVLAAVTGAWLLHRNEPASGPMTWTRIFNNSDQTRQVLLPDSSSVWLNAFAEISYPADLDKQAEREVKLEGEAYFIIKGRTDRGFVVKTGNLQTWVLGTEFNVEAYAEEEMVKVSLHQGKVRVNYVNKDGSRSDGKILMPGQMAMYLKNSFLLSIGKTAVAEPGAWIKEGVVLNDVSLRDALQRIGRKYHQKIVFDTVMVSRYRHITAHYEVMSLDQILSQLGFTCDFNYKIVNNKYTISFKPKHGISPVRK